MYIEQFNAGSTFSLLSQLAKFSDLPSNAWDDYSCAVHKLAQGARELIAWIDNSVEESERDNS